MTYSKEQHMTINLDFDTSDDDSIMKTYLARVARPAAAPLKKRDVVSVFSLDSSDDDEIATLTGSQPLSITEDVSLDSPGIATQQSPLEKIDAKKSKVKQEESVVTVHKRHQHTTIAPTTTTTTEQENTSTQPKPKQRISESSLALVGLSKLSAENDQSFSSSAKRLLLVPEEEEAKKKKPSTKKKPRKDQGKTKKGKGAALVQDIHKPLDQYTEKANARLLDTKLPNPVTTTTTLDVLDKHQQHSKQRSDVAAQLEANSKATSAAKKKKPKKVWEHEADKMNEKSTNQASKVEEDCHPPASDSDKLQGLKAIYAQIVEPVHTPEIAPDSSSKHLHVSDQSITLPTISITEMDVISLQTSVDANNSSTIVQQKKPPNDVTIQTPSKTATQKKRSKKNQQEVKSVLALPQTSEENLDHVVTDDSQMDRKQKLRKNILQTSTDEVLPNNNTIDATKEDRSSKEIVKKRKKVTHPEITAVTVPLQTTINCPAEERSTRQTKTNRNQEILVEKSIAIPLQPSSATSQPNGIEGKPLKATSGKTKCAPPKKISQKSSFQNQVLNRLFWSFKPFTLRTLSEDLKTTETTLEFCLLSLIDKGIVVKKDFTSSKGRVKTLYWANHDVKSKEVELLLVGTESTLDEREKTKQTVQTLQSKLTELKTELSQVLLQPSNLELNEQILRAESEVQLVRQEIGTITERMVAWASLQQKVKKRPIGTVSVVSSPRSLKRRIDHMRHEWKNRKAKCYAFLDLLADGLEKKPKDIIKLLNIDTDEMNDATL